MRTMMALLSYSLLGMVTAPAHAKVETREVRYEADGIEMKGLLAWDDAHEGQRPGVLVVHEWWGHNDYVRSRARQLAELGYVAFALDMYGDGKTADHPDKAGAFSSAVFSDLDGAEARFRAAKDVLTQDPHTDPDNVAAIGYCFGGGVVLHMARRGLDLDGVVSFHGSLATEKPARKGEVNAKILVAHGADDPFVKSETIEAFKEEMKNAGVDYRFVSYDGAVHAFTNPGATELGKKFNLPLAYDAEADQKSWSAMKAFFQDIFTAD
ncbi:MAG: dienelactone hydrolase family protein [Myxococcota bacterium]